jgi:hypothetical protein
MPRIQFVNQAEADIIGYVTGGTDDNHPAHTKPIPPNGDETVPVPSGGGFRVTIQWAGAPPLSENSPQKNIVARCGGVEGSNDQHYAVILTKNHMLAISRRA